jgi:FdhD protein
MTTPVRSVEIIRLGADKTEQLSDLVVTEEPLEIRVGHGPEDDRKQFSLSVTMRTPGSDEALCLGFLYTEAVIESVDQVLSVKYCEDLGRKKGKENLMRVELKPEVVISDNQFKRNFYTTSSCGVCGKASIDAIKVACEPLKPARLRLTKELLFALPEKLREAQQVFRHTGGLHASALFTQTGELIAYQEDVGRHNALDKLIGLRMMQGNTDFTKLLLLLSGRISFELVQKALRAGIPVVAAVGAPSSLAVELAQEFGMTLIGFLKADRFNVYSGKEALQ